MQDHVKGKFVILFIFGVALLAVVAALWYRYAQTRRTLQFWGPRTASLLKSSSQAELLELAPADAKVADETATVTFDGRAHAVVRQANLIGAHGMLNVRNALTMDASYGWDQLPQEEPPHWQYALRLSDGQEQVIVLFDLEHALARPADRDSAVSIAPIVKGLREFFAEQFPPPPKNKTGDVAQPGKTT